MCEKRKNHGKKTEVIGQKNWYVIPQKEGSVLYDNLFSYPKLVNTK